MTPEEPTVGEMNPQLAQIIELAQSGKDEDWEKIDQIIPAIANDKEFYSWAKENLGDGESNLRDLSATIIESSQCSLTDEDIKNLEQLMRENDKNPYPSFRAACALARRIKDDPRISGLLPALRNKLKLFLEDPNVSDIARSYSSDLNRL